MRRSLGCVYRAPCARCSLSTATHLLAQAGFEQEQNTGVCGLSLDQIQLLLQYMIRQKEHSNRHSQRQADCQQVDRQLLAQQLILYGYLARFCQRNDVNCADHEREQRDDAYDLLYGVKGRVKSNRSDDAVVAHELAQADGGEDHQNVIGEAGGHGEDLVEERFVFREEIPQVYKVVRYAFHKDQEGYEP